MSSANPEREHLPGADQASAPSNCSANWTLSTHGSMLMWTWTPTPGVRYGVTQLLADIQAHVTTGTRYKFSRTIGSYATVKEAKAACELRCMELLAALWIHEQE